MCLGSTGSNLSTMSQGGLLFNGWQFKDGYPLKTGCLLGELQLMLSVSFAQRLSNLIAIFSFGVLSLLSYGAICTDETGYSRALMGLENVVNWDKHMVRGKSWRATIFRLYSIHDVWSKRNLRIFQKKAGDFSGSC